MSTTQSVPGPACRFLSLLPSAVVCSPGGGTRFLGRARESQPGPVGGFQRKSVFMRRLVGLGWLGLAAAPLMGCPFAGCAAPGTVGGPSAVASGGGGSQAGQGGNGGASSEVVVIKLDGSAGGAVGSGGSTSEGAPPSPDANCGSVTSTATRQPADMLLVLDRSSSMNYSTSNDSTCGRNTSNCTPRWPALTAAVNTTLSSTADTIQWGLKLFTSPTGGQCAVDSGVEVPVAATSVTAIEAQIAATSPSNNTPTAQAIAAATAYLATLTDPNAKYILLATDGEPNCAPGQSSGTTNVQGTIDAIAAAKAAGFSVYVVGIGPSVGNLDNFAAAGGTGNYYPATSPQALTDAFASISKLVATCVFTSPNPPPDPNNVAVYLNKSLVAKDDGNGWSFGSDPQTIVLNGSACDAAMSGAGSSVQILFGCPGGPAPPPVIP
jgi:hypothetical protein